MRDRGSLRASLRSPLSALRASEAPTSGRGRHRHRRPAARTPDPTKGPVACCRAAHTLRPKGARATALWVSRLSTARPASGAFRWRASVRVYSVLGSGVRFCVRGSRAMPLWPAAGVRGAPSWYAVVFLSCQPAIRAPSPFPWRSCLRT
jgi:hypothetical protein